MDKWTCFQISLDAARARERALTRQLQEERERVRAMEIVVGALTASVGWRGLDRRRFKALILAAAGRTPDAGPEAARHGVFLAQASRILARRGTPPAQP